MFGTLWDVHSVPSFVVSQKYHWLWHLSGVGKIDLHFRSRYLPRAKNANPESLGIPIRMQLLPSEIENCWKLLTMQVVVVRFAPASRFASAEFFFLGIQSTSSVHRSVRFSLDLNFILSVSSNCLTSRSFRMVDGHIDDASSFLRLAEMRLASNRERASWRLYRSGNGEL